MNLADNPADIRKHIPNRLSRGLASISEEDVRLTLKDAQARAAEGSQRNDNAWGRYRLISKEDDKKRLAAAQGRSRRLLLVKDRRESRIGNAQAQEDISQRPPVVK